MFKLAILSRDADAYAKNIQGAGLPELEISFSGNSFEHGEKLLSADILLAEPDLAAEVVDQCSNLKWLQSTWAGVKPLTTINNHSMMVTGVKDVFGKQMREYVFAYLLYYSRNIPLFEKQKNTNTWLPPATSSLYGKTMGIMGVGSIGKEVAKTAKAFDMQVRGLTSSSRDCEHVDEFFTVEQKCLFAQGLDYLVCLLPHTSQTEGLIDTSLLNSLPEHCVLINAGRGQVIDDQALLEALAGNQIKAAVLDVFDQEPLPPHHPFWSIDNLHITQHTAAISQVSDISDIFMKNYERFIGQEALNYQIDLNKGY